MFSIIKNLKIGTVKTVSKCKKVTWFYPLFLFVSWENPFNPKVITKPWCSSIPAGGFHFLGFRVSWSLGYEYINKRIENL